MSNARILWADDEIEHLTPHIIFLENKGYSVTKASNGNDALDILAAGEAFDIIFLDENMPGLSGLETLERIKMDSPNLPVVMITKSEEEYIMEDAIGSKIADYLIKPVNPNQILLSLRKNLEGKKLIGQRVFTNYTKNFGSISMELNAARDLEDYMRLFEKLTYWGIELGSSEDSGLKEMLESQLSEANNEFAKFIKKNYEDLIGDTDNETFSHNVLNKHFFPEVKAGEKNLLVVVDNLRFDQYQILKESIQEIASLQKEGLYSSILPTATQFARNALFAGMLPNDIKRVMPQYWVDENEEDKKNAFEQELLAENMKRNKIGGAMKYFKVSSLDFGKKLADSFETHKEADVICLVYNFVDMLSHARTEMEVIKELASDEEAYRSITKSWFERSPLLDIIKKSLAMGYKLFITTDHGTVRCKTPITVVGDKNTSTNLRYKQGKNLNYKAKEVYAITHPEDAGLPKVDLSSSYIFALGDSYFVYPNNKNQFVKFYLNTFQHGGVSLEEMLIPYGYFAAK